MSELSQAPDAPLDAIEWRVDGKPNQDGKARFVPYLKAPRVADMLDGWVGQGGWRDVYEVGEIAGKPAVWCHLSIRCGDEWVTKTDVGVPSNFEGQKGAVSDAFKRVASVKWGVGRNVYRLPSVWAPCRIDNKGNAWPTAGTRPAIEAELKRLGLDGEVDVHDGTGDADPDRPLMPERRVIEFVKACEEAGVDYEQVVDAATEGRTMNPAEVFADEQAALRKAKADAVAAKEKADG